MSDEIDTTTEVWKTISGFSAYSISSIGRLRRDVPDVRHPGISILRPNINGNGYWIYHLYRNGTRTMRTAHSLVAEAFLERDPNPARTDVNHKNGIKTDNRVENFEWVTHAENIQHSYTSLGRKAPHGDCHFYAKLTVAKVIIIKRLLAEGTPRMAVAAYFEVHHDTIRNILRGTNWKHVP